MKKYFLIISLMSFSYSALAETSSIPFNNWHIGAGIGVQQVDSFYDYYHKIEQFDLDSHILDKTKNDIGKVSGLGEVFLGYGKTFPMLNYNKSYYLGVELFGRYNNISIVNRGSSEFFSDQTSLDILTQQEIYSVELKNKYSLIGALKAGIVLTPNLLFYGLLGADYANFNVEINAKGKVLGTDNMYHNATPYHRSFNKNKTGVMPGLGLEVMLSEHLSLRTQYTYSYYGKVKAVDTLNGNYTDATNTTHPFAITHNYSFEKLSRGLFSLDLTYYLD